MQVYGRAWFRIATPRPDLRPAPAERPRSGQWVAACGRTPSLVGPSRFRLLNEERDLDETGWDRPDVAKLWRYNLHYFDDLTATNWGTRAPWHATMLARWVGENPPGTGSGWEPYPTSLRIVNWIKWSFAGNILSEPCRHSLAVQARWLAGRLEWHLLGNHLFANAKALVFAGLYFDGPEAERWLERGLTILATQVPEQILPDGGQFERSPMYHALALEDVADLCNVARAFAHAIPDRHRPLVDKLPDVAVRMADWLTVMSHPDGQISLFNDAAIAIAATPADLLGYVRRLGYAASTVASDGITHLADSGYVRVQRGPLVALLDVGPVGPDYLPGHAHADTLSFEMSLYGARVLVNSGTSQYGVGPERHRQRGTAAHNTVSIDNQDSSEVWGGFRVARRARPFDLTIGERDGMIEIACAHDGYQRLSGQPVHRRRWSFDAHRCTVVDTVDGRGSEVGQKVGQPVAPAVSHWHWAPGIEVSVAEPFNMILAGGSKLSFAGEAAHWHATASTWHPEFGKVLANRKLTGTFEGRQSTVRMQWS